MKKTQLLQSAFMAASMLLMASEVMATPPGGGGGGAGAPIDGGITLLLGAGASYSIKKLRDRKSN